MLLPASITELDKNNGYDDLDKKILKLIVSNNEPTMKQLLIPIDLKHALAYNKEIYNKFIEKRKNLKTYKDRNKLYKLYLFTFQKISKNIFTDAGELIARHHYEMRILKKLQKDLKEENLLTDKKDLFMINIKKLLVHKSEIYEMLKHQNRFFAKNIKQYLSMGTDVSLEVISSSDMYINFLKILNEGEVLLEDDADVNSFKEFEEFKERIRVLPENMQSLVKIKNKSIRMKIFINYWSRGLIYGRYLSLQLRELLKIVEKEKIFFENL